MIGALDAAIVILAAFGGIGFVIGVVALSILVADGKVTFPGTNMRRLQHAKVELELQKLAFERESVQASIDAAIDKRMRLAIEPIREEVA